MDTKTRKLIDAAIAEMRRQFEESGRAADFWDFAIGIRNDGTWERALAPLSYLGQAPSIMKASEFLLENGVPATAVSDMTCAWVCFTHDQIAFADSGPLHLAYICLDHMPDADGKHGDHYSITYRELDRTLQLRDLFLEWEATCLPIKYLEDLSAT